MAKDYCNLEEKIEPLAEHVRGTLTAGGDPDFHHDVSVGILMLLEELERNEHDLKLAHMMVANRTDMDVSDMDIAFCEVLEKYEYLKGLYKQEPHDPEGYRK